MTAAEAHMHPQVEALDRRLDLQTHAVEAFVRGLDPDLLDRRPTPRKWSVGEHLAHLPRTTRPYVEAMGEAARKARERGRTRVGREPFRGSWTGRWMVKMMEPPPRRRVRTLKRLVPPRHVDREAGLADFRSSQDEARKALAMVDGLDADRVRFGSPFLFLLRMTVLEGYAVVAAHTDRHLWLMRETAERLGVTASG